MKRLLLLTRILFFLSFLLPFFFFQMCGPSKKEREVSITQAKQDSINASVEAQRIADSIHAVAEQVRIMDSIKLTLNKAKLDSFKLAELKKNVPVKINRDIKEIKEPGIIEKIWGYMLFPTKNSISALGISTITVALTIDFFNWKNFEIKGLLEFLLPVNILIGLTLILLFIFKRIRLSRVFSIISLIFFIILIFKYHEQGILWGFWVAFILNMIDLILVNMILYKPKPD
jgi:hypothetical protein